MTNLMMEAQVTRQLCGSKMYVIMSTVIFAIVLLHLLVGFGYVLYRISSSDAPKEDTDSHKKQSDIAP